MRSPTSPNAPRRPGLVAPSLLALAMGLAGTPASARSGTGEVGLVDRVSGNLSVSLVGMYRKTMEIESEISRHAERYGVDPQLARAICLYESGGNRGLTSQAGAEGYFQVMPATFRLLGVETNVEAGIKYFAQMRDRFEREDLALAAYNGGPAHILRQRPMRMETLQYVVGISYYKNVLREHEPAIRAAAKRLHLDEVRKGEDWWSVTSRTGVPLMILRLHNPFLAHRPLKEGNLIVYPDGPYPMPVAEEGDTLRYISRLGDLYLNLAYVFGISPDDLRRANGLWHVDTLLPGTLVVIPLEREAEWTALEVLPGEDLGAVARRTGYPEWSLIRDNRLWTQDVSALTTLRIDPSSRIPRYVLYTVRRGDTLSAIAGRHGVTLGDLRRFNGLPASYWKIHAGQVLKIPTS